MAFDYSNPYGIIDSDDINVKNFKEISSLGENTYLIGYDADSDEDIKILGTAISGGTPGTLDYNQLENKPSINGELLIGDISLSNIGAQPAGNYVLREELSYELILKQDKLDNNLLTTNKTIVGAINELKNNSENTVDKRNNLSDLTNIADARTNLDVYSKEEINDLISDIGILDTELTIIEPNSDTNLILFKNKDFKIVPPPNSILNIKIKVDILVNNDLARLTLGFMTYTDNAGNVSASDVYINIKNSIGIFDWTNLSFDVQYFDENENTIIIKVSNISNNVVNCYTITEIETISTIIDNPKYINTLVNAHTIKELSLFKDGTTFITTEPNKIYNVKINGTASFDNNVKYSKIEFLIHSNNDNTFEVSDVFVDNYNTIGSYDWEEVSYDVTTSKEDSTKIILFAKNNSDYNLSYFVNTQIKEIQL